MRAASLKSVLPRLVVGLLLLLATAFWLRNAIALVALEEGIEHSIGFPVHIGAVDLSPLLRRLEVRDVTVVNPARYGDTRLVVAPEATVRWRPSSLLGGSPHIDAMAINIRRVTVVKDPRGRSNLGEVKDHLNAHSGRSRFAIDKLTLHVGEVMVLDNSVQPPSRRTLHLNISASYDNITDSTDVTRLILLTVMEKAQLPRIDIDTAGLKKGLGDITTSAGRIVRDTAGGLQQAGKGMMESLQRLTREK